MLVFNHELTALLLSGVHSPAPPPSEQLIGGCLELRNNSGTSQARVAAVVLFDALLSAPSDPHYAQHTQRVPITFNDDE